MAIHEKILLIIVGIYLSIRVPIDLIAYHQKKVSKDKERIKEFLRLLAVDLHEYAWKKDTKMVSVALSSRLSTELRILLETIDRFPKNIEYPSDGQNKMLFEDVELILRAIHLSYRKNPASLDVLIKEFFQILEGSIQKTL